MEIVAPGVPMMLPTTVVQPSLHEQIKKKQSEDEYFKKIFARITDQKAGEFHVSDNGILRFRGRLCVPAVGDLRENILKEAHRTPYTIHPGGTKIYKDLKVHYWWLGMKKDVGKFVERCLTCQ